MPKNSGPHGPMELSETAGEPSQPSTGTGSSTTPAQVTTGMDSGMVITPAMPPAINWADGLDVEIPENLNIDWSEYATRYAATQVLC
jgi:hypothetical protein